LILYVISPTSPNRRHNFKVVATLCGFTFRHGWQGLSQADTKKIDQNHLC
jgi:hypothetical protein